MTFLDQISREKNHVRNFSWNIRVISDTPAHFSRTYGRGPFVYARIARQTKRSFASRRTRPWNLGVVSRRFANRLAFPSVGGGWFVRRVVWCVADRAWSSLNLPIMLRSDPLPPSLSLFLSLFPSSFPSTFQIRRSFSPSLSSSFSHPYFPLPPSYPLPTLHLLCAQATKRTVTSRCPFDRFIETATHSASHLHELFFITLDDSPPRVDKRTNRDQHLTFCQANDYSCAKGLQESKYRRVHNL